MSEYQYFEFVALDRRLSPNEQAELRRYSSRAQITAHSFSNEYHWGDFKGDAADWMARYFDAHVHVANWGTHCLMLRLPRHCLPAKLTDYAAVSSASRTESVFSSLQVNDECVLTWEFNDDSGDTFFEEEEGSSQWMSALLPLRDELRRGDWRSLYLGWLARVDNEEIGDDELEPPVPPGLQDLTPAQQALADFLLLDPDWLGAAAAGSPVARGEAMRPDNIMTWTAQADRDLLATAAAHVLQGDGRAAEAALRNAYSAWQRTHAAVPESAADRLRRSVDQIGAGVASARHRRLDREKRERDAAETRAANERAARLAHLALAPDIIWQGIDKTLHTGSGRAYDLALQATRDLAEALSNAGREPEFRRGLVRLLSTHGKRKAWLERLRQAGLYSG